MFPCCQASSPLTTQVFSKWLIPALMEWGVIVLLFGAGYCLDHWLVWVCVVVLLGSRQHALGVLGHDGAHRAAAKNRHLNDLATQVLCMWPLAVGLGGFRRFHFQHHRHFGTDLDPELRFKNQWSETQWKLPATKVRIIGYFLLDLVGFGVPEVLKASPFNMSLFSITCDDILNYSPFLTRVKDDPTTQAIQATKA